MHLTEIDDHISLVDLEIAGARNSIASYILRGDLIVLVETGPRSSIHELLQALETLDVGPRDVKYVVVSHIHLDHSGGAGTLLKHLPDAKLIVHERGAPHMVDPRRLWTQARGVLGSIADLYGRPEPIPEDRIIPISDGVMINVGDGLQLKVIETLGHASHHLSFYDAQSRGIFTGDAAGIYLKSINSVVPTTPSPFRMDIAIESLNRLAEEAPEVLYYSHFGKVHDAVQRLHTYIGQLRLWASKAKRGIQHAKDLSAIRQEILAQDPALQRASQSIKDHPILAETVFNQSVEGVVRFVEKFETP